MITFAFTEVHKHFGSYRVKPATFRITFSQSPIWGSWYNFDGQMQSKPMAPWKKLECILLYLPLENSFSVENVQFHTAPNCVQIAAKIHKIPDKGNTDSVLKSVTTFRSKVLGKGLRKKNWTSIFFSVNFFDILNVKTKSLGHQKMIRFYLVKSIIRAWCQANSVRPLQ